MPRSGERASPLPTSRFIVDRCRPTHGEERIQTRWTGAFACWADSDSDAIVDLSLRAWTPVIASFKVVLGSDLYARVHPDWHADQAASVQSVRGQ